MGGSVDAELQCGWRVGPEGGPGFVFCFFVVVGADEQEWSIEPGLNDVADHGAVEVGTDWEAVVEPHGFGCGSSAEGVAGECDLAEVNASVKGPRGAASSCARSSTTVWASARRVATSASGSKSPAVGGGAAVTVVPSGNSTRSPSPGWSRTATR